MKWPGHTVGTQHKSIHNAQFTMGTQSFTMGAQSTYNICKKKCRNVHSIKWEIREAILKAGLSKVEKVNEIGCAIDNFFLEKHKSSSADKV